MRTLLIALLLVSFTKLHSAEPPATYCNPLPIPNYPIGLFARNVINGGPDTREGWLLGHSEQFRELADPVVLWHDGKWYLDRSSDMAWFSEDQRTKAENKRTSVALSITGQVLIDYPLK
jgi:hypothetical protein